MSFYAAHTSVNAHLSCKHEFIVAFIFAALTRFCILCFWSWLTNEGVQGKIFLHQRLDCSWSYGKSVIKNDNREKSSEVSDDGKNPKAHLMDVELNRSANGNCDL